MATFASQYGSLESFLADLALAADFSGETVVTGPTEQEFVTLSTVHQAKGLEVPVVFLADPGDTSTEGKNADFHVSRMEKVPYLAMSVRRAEGREPGVSLCLVAHLDGLEDLALRQPLERPPQDLAPAFHHLEELRGILAPELLRDPLGLLAAGDQHILEVAAGQGLRDQVPEQQDDCPKQPGRLISAFREMETY